MKPPSYIKIEPIRVDGKDIIGKVTIKRWAVPRLVYLKLSEDCNLKWWQWVLYLYFCMRVMIGWGEEIMIKIDCKSLKRPVKANYKMYFIFNAY
jgi:hypothetical protein